MTTIDNTGHTHTLTDPPTNIKEQTAAYGGHPGINLSSEAKA